MKAMTALLLSVSFLAASHQAAMAQEGCRTARSSCSQINADCTQRCQKGTNPSACVARLCTVPFDGCKATGIWKSVASVACWKTNNRS